MKKMVVVITFLLLMISPSPAQANFAEGMKRGQSAFSQGYQIGVNARNARLAEEMALKRQRLENRKYNIQSIDSNLHILIYNRIAEINAEIK